MSLVLREKEVWKMQMFQILKNRNNLLKRMRGNEILLLELFFEKVESKKEKKAQVLQNNESGKEKALVPRQTEMSLRMKILKKLMCPSQKMLPWRLIVQVLQILKQMLVHQKQMLKQMLARS